MSAERGKRSLCDCGICRLSRALAVKDMTAVESGVEWMLERWADDGMRLMCVLNALKDWIDAGADLPEDVLRAFDAAAAGTAKARDWTPPERHQIVYAPTFVESYAELTGADVKAARSALREGGSGSFHLEAVQEAERENGDVA